MNDAPLSEHSPTADAREQTSERLLALLESAQRGSRELTTAVYEAIGCEVIGRPRTPNGVAWRYRGRGPSGRIAERWETMQDLTESLDAALSLVPEGWHAILYTETNCAELYDATLEPRAGIKSRAEAATLPLAVCAAAIRLRARQAKP
jgi:hypothetical protein